MWEKSKKLSHRENYIRKISTLLTAVGILTTSVLAYEADGFKEPADMAFLPREDVTKKLADLKMRRDVLPSRVDHTHSQYMRPVFNQAGGSCGSASRISYMLAYELNNYRDVSGADSVHMYPSHFTWLLTGQNSGKDAMAKFNGVPNVLEYGGPLYSFELGGNVGWPTDDNNQEYGWMQGYNKWRSAMDNRLEKTENIKFETQEDLEYIKWWIYNHHGDQDFNEGAVCGGGVASNGWTIKQIPAGEYREGEYIVTAFGPTIDHGVTWSGYDDSISFDLNSNGSIEEDEKGAIIMLNSWGANWKNSGAVYIPYKLLFDNGRWSEHYYVRKEYQPIDVFKIRMEYNQRSNLKISIGISSDSLATEPEKIVAAEHFNYAGNGEVPLLGKWSDDTMHKEPMEFGLDLTDLTTLGFDTRKSFRYFLVLETADDATGQGVVHSLEVLRYTYENDIKDSTVAGSTEDQAVAVAGSSSRIVIPITVQGNSDATPEYLYVPQERMSVLACNSQESSSPAGSVLDGDASTMWHSRWRTGHDPYPHTLTVQIDSAYTLNGLEYLPRQDGSGNGRIGTYAIYVSTTGDSEGNLVDTGDFANNSQVKRSFFPAQKGQYITIKNYRAANGDDNTCMAEFNLFYQPEKQDVAVVKSTTAKVLQSYRITKEKMYIDGLAPGGGTIGLYSMQGRLILEKELQGSETSVVLSLKSIANGHYLLQVKSPLGIFMRRVQYYQ